MSNKCTVNILNLLGFIFLLYSSYLFCTNSNTLTGEQVSILFRPAPYAFSIWGLIYIALFIWIVKGFLATPKESALYKDVGLWFFTCTLLTGLSVLVPLKVSSLFIIGALISSLIVYNINDNSCLSEIYKLPFSLFCGWLSVATIVNISLFLKSIGFHSTMLINEIGWTVLVLIFATIIAIFFTLAKNDIISPLVFIWAYVAIMIENPTAVLLNRSIFIMLLILLGVIIYAFFKKVSCKPCKLSKN